MIRTIILHILLILLVACSIGQELDLTVCIADTGETSLVPTHHAHDCNQCGGDNIHVITLSDGVAVSHADNHTHIPLQETLPSIEPPARIQDVSPETDIKSIGVSAIMTRQLDASWGISSANAPPSGIFPLNDSLSSLIGTVISLS